MAERILTSQTNFSGGQCDLDSNRREDAKVAKTGGRVMSNWRQRATGTLVQRPGRTAITIATGPRSERFRMQASQELIIVFSTNALYITDAIGNVIISNSSANYLWDNTTVALINWTVCPDRIVICFPGMRPQLIFWNSSQNTFSFAAFSFRTINGIVQGPFFRSADLGATMSYNAYSGEITLTCSQPLFTNGMLGTLFSIMGYQVTVNGVGSFTPVTSCAALISTVMPTQVAWHIENTFTTGAPPVDFPNTFPFHCLAETTVSKLLMEVNNATMGPGTQGTINATLINQLHASFLQEDSIASAYGVTGSAFTGTGIIARFFVGNFAVPVLSVVTWQQEFMNGFMGWPQACAYDHNRLVFTDFPQRPETVLWSSIGSYDSFWVDSGAAQRDPTAGSLATSAIFEFIDGKPRARNVVAWNGDTFVFTDSGVYYVPISAGGNPLKPGSVEFRFISDATANGIKPAVTRDALIFVSASGDRISSIVRTGNFTTPYVEQDLTEYHSQLFTGADPPSGPPQKVPRTISVGLGDDNFPERYIYVLMTDGSVVVGRVQPDHTFVGWMPWTGAGTVSWLSVGHLNVLFNTKYGTQQVLEYEDNGQYLDHTVSVNTPPARMLFSGNGPFIAFANGTVRVMDGAIDYGVRNIDATGNLLRNPDDDFSSATAVGGKPFQPTFTPFVTEAAVGQAMGQRQRRRKITRAVAVVAGSNGFTFGGRTIPPYNFGDNALGQPTLKSTTYLTRPLGRDFDPSITLIKDFPGPLDLLEFSIEVTV